ncbi:MAG TPA: S1/P1 nuclease [Sphingomicrobium sp.]|nr:S1/P1 nuclease [Sphingomicrobium sp.]
MKFLQGRIMRAAAAFAVVLAPSSPAVAWGSPGHQYVGNLAWLLLNPNARNRVRQILGPNVSLGAAAVWPDCVRSVDRSSTGEFSYEHDRYTPQVCVAFESAAEQEKMIAYAERNWTNCLYGGRPLKCHQSFHFADVNVHIHSDYKPTYIGTSDNDVVHGIRAAVARLKCKPSQTCDIPAPFALATKREALLLLAHLVGDLHQPLHVGAIYLDTAGLETDDSGVEMHGGNYLLLSPGEESDNLHHAWDTVSSSIGSTPSANAIKSGCLIAPLPNPTVDPPEVWASETILAARAAYNGMRFRPDATASGRWDVEFIDKPQYNADRRSVQARQVIIGGARLAAILNSIWPSSKVAVACR